MSYKLPADWGPVVPYQFDARPLDVSVAQVSSVKPSRIRTHRFDLTVAETHNFVAGGFVVHNCGKGQLAKALPFPVWEFDPAIPEKAESPRPADICVCTDVLEHVEPELLTGVLADLRRCTKQVGYFVVHTGAATKTLADGRNAHLIQRDAQWWRVQLQQFFTIGKQITKPPLVTFVVGPKVKKQRPALDRASVAVA
jgi:hypothetical protein